MGFWVFMLIMVLLVPLTMLIFGRMFLSKGPKDINGLFGYRTSMSMKNKDTWNFAHRHFGKLWFRCGLVLLPLSLIAFLFVLGKDTETVGNTGLIIMAVQFALMLGSIFLTEAALKKTFNQNGTRR